MVRKIILLAVCFTLCMMAFGQANTFAGQKGNLPVPISGSCKVVRAYGSNVVGGIELGSNGVSIRGKNGCNARAVFEGKVSAIYSYDTGYCVILRHGSYLTVYAHLEEPCVKVGQSVKALAALGKVARDATGERVLHFQVRNEREPLNPSSWIKF